MTRLRGIACVLFACSMISWHVTGSAAVPVSSSRSGGSDPAGVQESPRSRGDRTQAETPSSGEAASGPTGARKRLSLEQVSGRAAPVSFRGRLPQVSWAPDGRHLVVQRDGKSVTIDALSGKQIPAAKPATSRDDAGRARSEAQRQACGKALAATTGIKDDAAARLVRRARRAGDVFVIEHENDLYAWRPGMAKVRRLTASKGREESAAPSPDGAFVAYRRQHDLYLADTKSGKEEALSTDGSDTLLYGRLDWVYQEEVYGRGTWDAKWWSPDAKRLAFLRIDQSPVSPFTVVNHLPYRLSLNVTRYPKAGDPNPIAKLAVASARTGKVIWMDLSRYEDQGPIIVRVVWSPDSKSVVFQVQNRQQTWLDLLAGDPRTGKTRILIHEKSRTWTNVLGQPRWLRDGTFLWFSERTGHKHLYRYDMGGKLVAQVTDGEWECRAIKSIDEKAGVLLLEGSSDSAIDTHTYRVGLRGEGLLRLTKGRGTHRTEFNADRTLFLDRVSTVSSPPEVRLCRSDGTVERVLGRAAIPALEEYLFASPELLEIPARDGFLLDAILIKPPDFDPSKQYPVWLPTYSGPAAPTVRNAWSPSAWDQFLAQQGFLVLKANNRSSSNKGKTAIDACYRQLGVSELEDLEDAVEWLCRNPWADRSRVGITGGSYGGFMTAYALTHGTIFTVGVAQYGVYDWRCYDTIYTERYMATPQDNPEGYKATSCVAAAANLHGDLLLIHGTMDDNVHMQNLIQFIYALQKADKPFEMMLYPTAGHGIGNRAQRWHSRQLVWRFIREHMLEKERGRAESS